MRALLVRVGADSTNGGGGWIAPADSRTGAFVYAAIPEAQAVVRGLERPYGALTPHLKPFGVGMPPGLAARHMHLDPDFKHLTYGDQGRRAQRILKHLSKGDLLVFYAGLRDIVTPGRLIYGLIGIIEIDRFLKAGEVEPADRDRNAHSRRDFSIAQEKGTNAGDDLVVFGRRFGSGRFKTLIDIGEYRDRAYRVRSDILAAWGDLSVKDGYIQRSAYLPEFQDAGRFRMWLDAQKPTLLHANN